MKRQLIKIIFILLFLGLLFVILVAISPLIMFTFEDQILKTELENKYIDQEYDGWQNVSVDRIGTFHLPDSWVFSKEGDVYYIENQNGDVIGYGTVTGDITSKYDIQSFMDFIIGSPTDELKYQFDTNFTNMHGSSFCSIDAVHASTSSLFHCIELKNNTIHLEYSSVIFILIIKDGVVPYEELISIAEAIVYSYTMLSD